MPTPLQHDPGRPPDDPGLVTQQCRAIAGRSHGSFVANELDVAAKRANHGEHQRLERIAKALGVGAVTEFAGWVPHHRVPEYLRRLSIYAAPSVHEESFGVAVLEASACGVPVVVSRVGGMPEVVEHQQTGFLVPPGDEVALADALERLVTSQELRRSMGAAGRRFVLERYSWDATARIVEDLYDRILNSQPAASVL